MRTKAMKLDAEALAVVVDAAELGWSGKGPCPWCGTSPEDLWEWDGSINAWLPVHEEDCQGAIARGWKRES